jgi:hypothetical protein
MKLEKCQGKEAGWYEARHKQKQADRRRKGMKIGPSVHVQQSGILKGSIRTGICETCLPTGNETLGEHLYVMLKTIHCLRAFE